MVFKSKIDAWIWLAFVISILAVAVTTIPAFALGEVSAVFVLGTLALGSFGMGLFLWMLMDTGYTVTEDKLKIRSGPFRWSVDRVDIQSLTRTRSPRNSPALSLDRIEVRHGVRGRVLVSPADAEGFAAALGLDLE